MVVTRLLPETANESAVMSTWSAGPPFDDSSGCEASPAASVATTLPHVVAGGGGGGGPCGLTSAPASPSNAAYMRLPLAWRAMTALAVKSLPAVKPYARTPAMQFWLMQPSS